MQTDRATLQREIEDARGYHIRNNGYIGTHSERVYQEGISVEVCNKEMISPFKPGQSPEVKYEDNWRVCPVITPKRVKSIPVLVKGKPVFVADEEDDE